jgi:hypothetical protein
VTPRNLHTVPAETTATDGNRPQRARITAGIRPQLLRFGVDFDFEANDAVHVTINVAAHAALRRAELARHDPLSRDPRPEPVTSSVHHFGVGAHHARRFGSPAAPP